MAGCPRQRVVFSLSDAHSGFGLHESDQRTAIISTRRRIDHMLNRGVDIVAIHRNTSSSFGKNSGIFQIMASTGGTVVLVPDKGRRLRGRVQIEFQKSRRW